MTAACGRHVGTVEDEALDASGETLPSSHSIVQRRYWLLDQLRPGDRHSTTHHRIAPQGARCAALNKLSTRSCGVTNLCAPPFSSKGRVVQLITPALTLGLPSSISERCGVGA